MIKITDLERVYRTEEVETVALNKMSLNIAEHEFVAVMGTLGCGKSTLLNIPGMLDKPDAGSFLFNGVEVGGYNENQCGDLRRQRIQSRKHFSSRFGQFNLQFVRFTKILNFG